MAPSTTPPAASRSPSPFRGGFWLALLLATPALADPPVVTSTKADKLAVTIYRDPDRSLGEISRHWPSSFALIAETRTVTLPPGEVTVRFEGVASGIVPQSAILFGASPRERNRDAALLSQRGLVDAFTGQRVILRRTDPATGKTVEEPATIRSAGDRLVATTPRGVEALYCTGLSQTLIYPHAPSQLSAKPVLSMLTKDQPGGTMTVTLAYIATGFDWDATYVATLAPDGKAMSLLGWMTMASGDDTSFPEATAAAVGGRIARSQTTRDTTGRDLANAAARLDRGSACWPAGRTHEVMKAQPPPPPPMAMAMAPSEIIVTSQRRSEAFDDSEVRLAVKASAENLGDLKLYRIPVPVTVAARSQKQVAFMARDRIAGELLYRLRIDSPDRVEAAMALFRFRNRKQDGLGEALPAGKAIVFQHGAVGRLYRGEATTPDKAVGEEVELTFGAANGVTVALEGGTFANLPDRILTVRNANPFAVTFEADFPADLARELSIRGKLADKPGKRVWRTTVPANGTASLRYRPIAKTAP